MQTYKYRTDISEDADFKASAVLRAAFELARESHAGQSRYKIDPAVPYITHPIMVYDLMRHMGVTNPTVLSAALLHDVREMCEPFKSKPLTLASALREKLEAQGVQGYEALCASKDISALVEQVTNHGTRYENKAMAQMKRAEAMSQDARCIKIADQTASLVCNQMMANGGDFRDSKAQRFAYKAYTLVRAISEDEQGSGVERAEITRWAALFTAVHDSNRTLLDARSAADKQAIRDDFPARWKAMLAQAAQPNAPVFPARTTRSVVFPKRTLSQREAVDMPPELFANSEIGGLLRADLDEEGRVIGFTTWAAPQSEENNFRNRLQGLFTQYLSNHGMDPITSPVLQKFMLGERMLEEARYHRLPRPMPARAFADAAIHVSCIGHRDREQLLRVAKDMERDYCFMRPDFR